MDFSIGHLLFKNNSWYKSITIAGLWPARFAKDDNYLYKAYVEDIKIRIEGLGRELPDVNKVDVHEINPGIVYDSANGTVINNTANC